MMTTVNTGMMLMKINGGDIKLLVKIQEAIAQKMSGDAHTAANGDLIT